MVEGCSVLTNLYNQSVDIPKSVEDKIKLPVYLITTNTWYAWSERQKGPSKPLSSWASDSSLSLLGKGCPLKSRFLAVPMNVGNNHWILAIVDYPFDIVDSDRPKNQKRTAIYFLDNLRVKESWPDEARALKALLAALSVAPWTLGHLTKQEIDQLPVYYPLVRGLRSKR